MVIKVVLGYQKDQEPEGLGGNQGCRVYVYSDPESECGEAARAAGIYISC